MIDNLIYVSQREYDALRSRPNTPVLGWWLSGVAAGFVLAVVLGYAK
jgi:hypothetical protein